MRFDLDTLPIELREISAQLGQDPLQIQGPGGNSSIKQGDVMWIKASGTELADAATQDIFVPVDLRLAREEAFGRRGDGSCKDTLCDPELKLRPSIETSFHAALDWPVVVHTHSVAALAHVTSRDGCALARAKLADLNPILISYAKPGLALTQSILDKVKPETQLILLENHGLICCGKDTYEVLDLIEDVERRLAVEPASNLADMPSMPPPEGFYWSQASWIAKDPAATARAQAGSYYPDHVVFLGPALPKNDDGQRPAILHPGIGVALRHGATRAQEAMLQCLCDVLQRVPEAWDLRPLAPFQEAELLDWDAEKYRQALADRGR